MRKKSFAAFLALALLVLVLSSCTFDGSGTQQSPSSQDSQESLDQESSSSESEAQEPAEEDIKGCLLYTSSCRISILGRIACGQPTMAGENIEDYAEIPNRRRIRRGIAWQAPASVTDT